MSNAWIHIGNLTYSSGQLAILCFRNFSNGHCAQIFNQIYSYLSCLQALLTSTILYSYMSVNLTLLGGGYKFSRKQNFMALFCCTLFKWSGWNVIWRLMKSSGTTWCCCLVSFIERLEIAAVVLALSKTGKLLVDMHLDVNEPIVDLFCSSLIQWQLVLNSRFWNMCKRPWSWFKVTGVQENWNFCASYLTKFSIRLDGIFGYAVEIC